MPTITLSQPVSCATSTAISSGGGHDGETAQFSQTCGIRTAVYSLGTIDVARAGIRVVKPSVSAASGRIGRRPRSPELRLCCAERPRAVAVRDVRRNQSGADRARHALLMARTARKDSGSQT